MTHFALAVTLKAGIIVLATYIGLKMPELYLKNTIGKRQHSMGRAFPDAMDLFSSASSLVCRSNMPFARSRRRSAILP